MALTNRCGPRSPSTSPSVKVGVIHHTVTSNSYSPSSAYAEIRAIYAYHTQSLGWSDIAYNVLVDQYGQIFEGRYGGLDRPVLSAATGGFNTSTFSVSALGNFQVASPSSAMVESIAQVLAWKLAISYVNPVGTSQLRSAGFAGSPFPEGQLVTFPNIIGHRDADYTACPGQYLYGELDTIRARDGPHAGRPRSPRGRRHGRGHPGTNGSCPRHVRPLVSGRLDRRDHKPDGSLLKTRDEPGSRASDVHLADRQFNSARRDPRPGPTRSSVRSNSGAGQARSDFQPKCRPRLSPAGYSTRCNPRSGELGDGLGERPQR